ncbi:MAG: hypothetical protein ABR500_00730 [Dermatophilaceae bacterium]|nr:hypothetical protein [Intrasporangiaceae bacterium]
MRAPNELGMRLLRALVLTGSGVGLGALAHTHAGAAHLGSSSALVLVAVLALSWVATARRVTWPVIALILAGGQLLTHLSLTAGHGVGSHDHGSGAVFLPEVAPVDGRMVLVHIGAWVVLTLLFTVGERALWRSVERIVTPWPVPVLPLLRPQPVAGAPVVTFSALAHVRIQGRAPPLG